MDWLTCTAHGDEASARLEDYGRYLLKEEADKGNDKSPWHSMGYVGLHAGHIDSGRRDGHSTILRISGGPAEGHLSTALSLADHVTRVDLAVTWRAAPADPHIGQNVYTMAELFLAQHPRAGVPSFTGDALGGYTCYIGDRRSPYYARVYNKEAERLSRNDRDLAKHYQACWRYEVEAHDERAMVLATAAADRDDRAAFTQQWLYEWFRSRGIATVFPESGADALVPGFHRRTDDESRLRHLAKNVAPTVARLRRRGRTQEVREALGFDPGADLIRQLGHLLARYDVTLPPSGTENDPPKGEDGNA